MLKALASSYTGLRAHQQMLDVAAHNLANVNTVAFKEKGISFAALPGRSLSERRLPVAGEPLAQRISGRGVSVASITSYGEEASLAFTGRNLDLAVAGEGYFRVIREDGRFAFTRGGNFFLDSEGRLVTGGGARLDLSLEPRAREKEVDFSTLEINPEGKILARFLPGEDNNFSEAPVKIGEVPLFRFTNPQGLYHIGENLFLPSAASGPPLEGRPRQAGFGEIKAGFLERAGVDLGRQMVILIRGQRALQASARAAVTADELWGLTLNVQP